MSSKHEYVIRFAGLKDDQETFEFNLKDSFFKVFESSEWDGGNINSRVLVSKKTSVVTLDLFLEGYVQVVCDRCLETYHQEINFKQTIYLKFGEEEKELDDNVIVLQQDDHQIDMGQLMYEYLVLALPVKRVHPDTHDGRSGCDPKMLQKLNEHVIGDEPEQIDPRWEELKKLMDKN